MKPHGLVDVYPSFVSEACYFILAETTWKVCPKLQWSFETKVWKSPSDQTHCSSSASSKTHLSCTERTPHHKVETEEKVSTFYKFVTCHFYCWVCDMFDPYIKVLGWNLKEDLCMLHDLHNLRVISYLSCVSDKSNKWQPAMRSDIKSQFLIASFNLWVLK